MPTKKKDHVASGSAIAAGGGVVGATGFVAGGVPGVKPNIDPLVQVNQERSKGKGFKATARKAKKVVPAVARGTGGGILGFRRKAHEGGIYGFKQQATTNAWKGATHDPHEAFLRGRVEGKIAPEEQVLRHLKGGKKAAGAAMAGGAATMAYGVHRARQKVEKADRDEKAFHGALLGGGAATAGVSHGAVKLLGSQEKKWSAEATHNVGRAEKLVPGMASPKVRRGKKVSFEAIRDADTEARKNPKSFKGVHPNVAQEAGRLRGAAIQQAHFADVYRSTGKAVGHLRGPGLVAAAAGAGGLAVSRKKDKVKKNLSAFGVEHG